jgi:hypothetical protein
MPILRQDGSTTRSGTTHVAWARVPYQGGSNLSQGQWGSATKEAGAVRSMWGSYQASGRRALSSWNSPQVQKWQEEGCSAEPSPSRERKGKYPCYTQQTKCNRPGMLNSLRHVSRKNSNLKFYPSSAIYYNSFLNIFALKTTSYF